jgi:hypothetical protein
MIGKAHGKVKIMDCPDFARQARRFVLGDNPYIVRSNIWSSGPGQSTVALPKEMKWLKSKYRNSKQYKMTKIQMI